MRNKSSIKVITMLTLCLGLIGGGNVALAKKGLVYTQQETKQIFSGSAPRFIDIGADGADPTTLTFQTNKKKGQNVAIWVNGECKWQSTEGEERARVSIYVDGNRLVGNRFLEQCNSDGGFFGNWHVMHVQGALKLAKGTHTLRVGVHPTAFVTEDDFLIIEDLSVIVMVQ